RPLQMQVGAVFTRCEAELPQTEGRIGGEPRVAYLTHEGERQLEVLAGDVPDATKIGVAPEPIPHEGQKGGGAQAGSGRERALNIVALLVKVAAGGEYYTGVIERMGKAPEVADPLSQPNSFLHHPGAFLHATQH